MERTGWAAIWRWDGKEWIRARRVSVECAECGAIASVASDKSEFRCPHGHEHDINACASCGSVYANCLINSEQGERGGLRTWMQATPCPHCGSDDSSAASVWQLVAQGGDRARRLLDNFTLDAAGGTSIPASEPCLIDFASSQLTIHSPSAEETVPYSEVTALQVSGSNTETSAGLWGGGFGVVGAAEGILAAAVINSLTRRTKVFTVLRIVTRSAEYVFSSTKLDSSRLQMELTPVQVRIRSAQAAGLPATRASVADELVKLVNLRDDGALTDEEFARAKARLLDGA